MSVSLEKNNSLAIARKVVELELAGVQQLLDELDESFVEAVEMIYNRSGRVIVTGLGKSGAIGRKIAATLASTGTTAYFLHAVEGVHGDLGMIHRDDVIVCLSKSGNSDELVNLMPVFKRIGVPIISITANNESALAKHSDLVLPIGNREEACPHDLAPTTSTTAMLVLGDALAIALLEKRKFSREDFAFLHPAGTLGKRLLIRVKDLMETGEQIPRVLPNATMKEAVLELASKRGICVVADTENSISGIVTNGDLNRLVQQTEHFFAVPVSEVMNSDPKMTYEDTLAYTVYKKMEEHRILAVPVINDQEKLVGVIHLHDIMRAGIV
ncbi:MAG: KpsF/GutQ family sugar-phosphate isomerase [Calditrichia bacterium]